MVYEKNDLAYKIGKTWILVLAMPLNCSDLGHITLLPFYQ